MVILIGASSAWASATELVAYSYDDNCLYRLNTSDMQPAKTGNLQISLLADSWEFVRASENSSYIVDRNANILYEISLNDASTISSIQLDQDVWVSRRGLAISPDGILYGLLSGMQLRTIDPSTGATTFVANVTGTSQIEAIAFSLDGTLYAVGDGSRVLYELDINTGSLSWIANLPVSDIDTLTFAPDGYLYGADAKAGMVADLYKIDPSTGIIELNGLVAQTLTHLEIVGPDEIAENSNASYKAMAHYDNNSTADVTASVEWSVEPNDIASIAAGLLATEMVDLPEDVTITAKYGEGDVNEIAGKDVSIFAICSSGSALDFEGTDDYVEINDSLSLRLLSTDFTISVWIKPDTLGERYFITKRNYDIHSGSGDNRGWGTKILGGKLGFGIFGVAPYYTSFDVVQTDIWQHFTYVFDDYNNTISFYKNGSYIESLNTGEISQSNKSLIIGSNSKNYSGAYVPFDGTIDEVAIYNRALSAGEIQTLQYAKPDTDDANLVGYWDFDKGEGQVAYDSAGGNDGQLGSTSGIDNSDPNWTDSIPTVGICSIEGIVERNLLNVLDSKLSILEQLYETMAQEEALWEYMDIVFKDRDFGNTSKRDVAKAKQKIHSAIQAEAQAETAVDQSIDKLDDALDTLGIE